MVTVPASQPQKHGKAPLVITENNLHPECEARLLRWALQAEARHLLPNEKVAKCYRVPVATQVGILYDQEHAKAHYAGLEHCHSVWMCPICSAKITTRRREEMHQAVRYCNDNGTVLAMQTFTYSHKRFDSLEESASAFLAARERLTSGKRWDSFVKRHAIVGTIRALEVTWSPRNGWHTHLHELVFFGNEDIDLKAYEREMRIMWTNALRSQGLECNIHGYEVTRTKGDIEDYIAKWGHEPARTPWGVESEMTKGHVKSSRDAKGKTPFQLLRDSLDGSKQAGRLFVEYANFFKGKRQLHWSKGLKAMLGLEDKSDDEIASEQKEEATLLGNISRADWKIVLANEVRGELLEVAHGGVWSAVVAFLQEIGCELVGTDDDTS